ncbi:unnamed protein product [Phytophthora fragariaefolia]|uniref:Sulfhydryl oxidase n=1 Tax=Phytophthora fragariaefolia TaxID=1490495 RepID=A0A9W6UD66_9STRA|nr:unnamed protein product [Phytophthora fragariaefolia]
MFAPEWEKVGEFYAQSEEVQVGAVDCNRHKEICTRENVHAYPTVKAHHVPLGSDEKVIMEVKGRKKLKPVVMWAETLLEEHGIESGVDVSTVAEEINLRRNDGGDADAEATLMPEDDTSPRMKYNRLFDAGKAVMLALESSFFVGTPVLEGLRYDAALTWLRALAATFPLEENRAAMKLLADSMKQQKSWSLEEWKKLFEGWRSSARELAYPIDLFDPRGDDDSGWAACKTYTCGLWTLFHSMSTRDIKAEDGWKPSETMAGIRLYMKNFFGCEECRQHFMEANPESLVKDLEASDPNGPHAVVMWAWKMHNSVNNRLNRNQWPSVSDCSSCYIDIGGPVSIGMSLIHEDEMMNYLTRVYGHEDKALFDEVIMATKYSPPIQGFNSVITAALIFVLVLVVFKTQRHRFTTLKDSGHIA